MKEIKLREEKKVQGYYFVWCFFKIIKKKNIKHEYRHMLVWLWKHSKRTGGQRVICAIFDGWGRRGYIPKDYHWWHNFLNNFFKTFF